MNNKKKVIVLLLLIDRFSVTIYGGRGGVTDNVMGEEVTEVTEEERGWGLLLCDVWYRWRSEIECHSTAVDAFGVVE